MGVHRIHQFFSLYIGAKNGIKLASNGFDEGRAGCNIHLGKGRNRRCRASYGELNKKLGEGRRISSDCGVTVIR